MKALLRGLQSHPVHQSHEAVAKNLREYTVAGETLKIVEDDNGGVATLVWQAVMLQCRYFERAGTAFAGKRVVELGSGTGFVGIYIAKRGAAHVYLTDIDAPKVLTVLEENTAANGVQAQTTVASLDWRSREDCAKITGPTDIIVVCECIYNGRTHEDLIATVKALSPTPDTLTYVCYAQRHPEAEKLFFERCAAEGFAVESVPEDELVALRADVADGLGPDAAGVFLKTLRRVA
eukprot:c11501_g1_i2.p2 GENE.c11501_g1_i2~~c11501_g1_i2.p2  ORF type:complete len:255 (-),score=53.80 c11501_g1_i2:259-963(-)